MSGMHWSAPLSKPLSHVGSIFLSEMWSQHLPWVECHKMKFFAGMVWSSFLLWAFPSLSLGPSELSYLSTFCINFPNFYTPYELSWISFPLYEWKNMPNCGLGSLRGGGAGVNYLVGKWELYSPSQMCWLILFQVPFAKDLTVSVI